MQKIRSLFVLGLFSASLLVSAETPTRAQGHCNPTTTPGSTSPYAVYDVGIDLHSFATFLEMCRRTEGCAPELIAHLAQLGAKIEELPAPWSAEGDRTEETAKFLRIAAALWRPLAIEITSSAAITPIHTTPTRLFYCTDEQGEQSLQRAVTAGFASVYPNLLADNNSKNRRRTDQSAANPPRHSIDLTSALERSWMVRANPVVGRELPMPARASFRVEKQVLEEYLQTARGLPVDPLLWAQWALERTRVFDAWNRGHTGSTAVKIALLDSGIDPDQSDFERRTVDCHYTPTSTQPKCNPEDASDPAGHGTALAGIIAATANNGYRVAGIHHSAELMNLKVFDAVSDAKVAGTIVDVVRALEGAIDRCAVVAVLAWGQKDYSPALWEAILRARAADVLVVTGAGNDQLDLDAEDRFFPASFRHPSYCQEEGPCLDNLIVVGATKLGTDEKGNLVDKKASFSNYGENVVDLGAPGVGIITLWLHDQRGGVVNASGTSAATAVVAGGAALVADALHSDPPPRDRFFAIRSRLVRGADRVRGLCDAFAGGRRLNVYNAVSDISMDDLCVCAESQPPTQTASTACPP